MLDLTKTQTFMQISNNFKLGEFTYSPTAIANGIDNTPRQYAIDNIKTLVIELLQPLRDKYGQVMSINSGFRCSELNTKVGGVLTSQHLEGKAADVRVVNPRDLLMFLLKTDLVFDQAILYPTFLHLSYNEGKNRRQVLYAKGVIPL